jgi:site-specific DNA recombinase
VTTRLDQETQQACMGSPTLKVIAYVRVSTNEQAENGVSLDAQAEKIQGYCTLNGWHCIEVARDDGFSAKDLKRPGL